MWAIAGRILAGLGLGKVIDWLDGDDNSGDGSTKLIMQMLTMIILLVGGGFAIYFFMNRKRR